MIIGRCKRNIKSISNQGQKKIVSFNFDFLLSMAQKSFILPTKAVNQLLLLNLGLK